MKKFVNTLSHQSSWTVKSAGRRSQDTVSRNVGLADVRPPAVEIRFCFWEKQRWQFKLRLRLVGGAMVGVKLSVMTRVGFTL